VSSLPLRPSWNEPPRAASATPATAPPRPVDSPPAALAALAEGPPALALPIRIQITARPTAWPWAWTQRAIGLLGCLALSPIFLVMYLLVRSTSRGPFLFSQLRPGYLGKPFHALKVRTMAVGAEHKTTLGTSRRDKQITRFGRLLRELKLDELPQLWNIARGEMELVGPRPLPIALDEELCRHIPNFALRYQVKPGLTNVSQVVVLDNKLGERLVEDWNLRFEGELHYIKNKSFAYDVVVLAMTLLFVLRKLGDTIEARLRRALPS
jgi:lipopolysaccharide/colanic/teichoic acid biosynthesis glycosyltransferase